MRIYCLCGYNIVIKEKGDRKSGADAEFKFNIEFRAEVWIQ